MKKFTLAAMLLLLTGGLVSAQIRSFTLDTKQPKLYEKAEWNINLTGQWENPYLQEDVALDMLITSPKGKKLVLPCYFESGESGKASVWKARFAPQETGTYNYTFRFSKAGNPAETSKAGKFTVAASKRNGFLHPKNNWAFEFDNGKPFRGIGENLAWESRASDDSKFFKELHQESKYNYEYMLRALAKHGGNFYRTWMCAWNLPLDWQKPSNSNRYTPSDAYYNPSAIKKIDRMVNLSDSLGLYIMLTLGQGNYSTRGGGFSPTAADFFVNPKSKIRYKNRLRYIIARWGYSTSIGAWELFNEVDNVQFGNKDKPISADSIVTWHDEMSTYIKATDPYKHLVTTSISHRDLKGLNSLPNMDFNQKHIYKNTAGIPEAIVSYEENFKKPYVIGEYSYEWDWNKNFDDFPLEMDSDFKRGLWYGLFSPTPILPMSWWWEYFDNRGTDAYMARIKTVANQMLASGTSLEQVKVTPSAAELKTLGVKAGNTTFIYAFNPGDSKQAAGVELASAKSGKLQVKAYDCESGRYKKAEITRTGDGVKVSVPELAAKADVVFIISESKQ